jgi:hypothetical protein
LTNSRIQDLDASFAKIEGNVFLRKASKPKGKAKGAVDLRGATIQGNLDCDAGQFASKGEAPALEANSAKIEGFNRRLRASISPIGLIQGSFRKQLRNCSEARASTQRK